MRVQHLLRVQLRRLLRRGRRYDPVDKSNRRGASPRHRRDVTLVNLRTGAIAGLVIGIIVAIIIGICCCCFLCPGCYGFEKRNQKRAPPPDTEMAPAAAPRTEEPPVVQGNVVETVAAEKK